MGLGVLKLTEKYGYESHFGGVILKNLITGSTRFLQPLDDANGFFSQLEELDYLLEQEEITPEKYLGIVDCIFDNYFACIDENN